MTLPIIRLYERDQQERLFRALYTIGQTFLGYDVVDQGWAAWVANVNPPARYPCMTMDVGNQFTGLAPNLMPDDFVCGSIHGARYVRMNSIDQFVRYAKGLNVAPPAPEPMWHPPVDVAEPIVYRSALEAAPQPITWKQVVMGDGTTRLTYTTYVVNTTTGGAGRID